MSNVLSDDKRQQIIALGRLGWSLRRIEEATGVRRETASAYLKTAGIKVRQPGWERAKPAIEVTTDSDPASSDNSLSNQSKVAKPAMQVTTDFGLTRSLSKPQSAAPTQSNCEPYREFIQESLGRDRNATAIYQDLVTDYGFPHSYQSVKRFVNKLQPPELKPARAVIITAPGEEAQVDYGTGPWVRDPQSGAKPTGH
jgi:transposase